MSGTVVHHLALAPTPHQWGPHTAIIGDALDAAAGVTDWGPLTAAQASRRALNEVAGRAALAAADTAGRGAHVQAARAAVRPIVTRLPPTVSVDVAGGLVAAVTVLATADLIGCHPYTVDHARALAAPWLAQFPTHPNPTEERHDQSNTVRRHRQPVARRHRGHLGPV